MSFKMIFTYSDVKDVDAKKKRCLPKTDKNYGKILQAFPQVCLQEASLKSISFSKDTIVLPSIKSGKA